MILSIIKCLYKALVDTINHDGVEHAGYIAFLMLLALFPFLVFFMSIIGAINTYNLISYVDESLIKESKNLITLIEQNVPQEFFSALLPRIYEILETPPQSILNLAIFGAIWTASSAVEGFRTILNRAYRVETPPTYILRRLLSIAQFLVIIGIIIIAIIVLSLLPFVLEYFANILHFDYQELKSLLILRYAILAIILLLSVMMLYYMVPNSKQSLIRILPGSIIVVFAWFVAGFLLKSYIENFQQVNLIYGSLAGIIIALLFFYLISMILIYGAEFNYHIWYLRKKYNLNRDTNDRS